ncbi:MAG: DUF2723 domain-containing protein [Chloroflexi bacterium]|nr:DUF2723 domain-containing protein [Chloroflexota bacterium]
MPVFRRVLRSPLFVPTVLVGGTLTTLYLLSAVTRVAGGDWGQFQTFGYLGGIPHAPGYPLLTGSVHLVTRVAGFAEPAHVANLVNASYAIAAGVGLFVVTAVLTRSRLAGFLATAVFTTGYSVWAQATQTGTMSLQTLIVVLLIGALVAYDDQPSVWRLAAVGFATGLSLTNHGISVFMLPATAVFVASRRFPGIARPRTLAAVAGAVVAGLLPWIYVVRGLFVPMPTASPEHRELLTVEGLVRLVFDQPLSLVGGVGTIAKPIGAGGLTFIDRWPLLANDMLRELGWGWLALAAVGWAVLARQRARLAGWIAWTGLTTIWFILASYPFFDSARYFAVIYALLAVCLAVAVGWLLRRAEPTVRRFAPSWARYAVLAAGVVVLAAGLRVQQQFTGEARDNIVQLRENAAEQAMIGIMRQMAPDSIYLTNWTSSWYARYAAFREGHRGIRIRTADYYTMGFDQAADILASGRRLYIQRSTPEYEAAYTVEPRWGVIYEVLPAEPSKSGG